MVCGSAVFIDRSPVVGGHQRQHLVVPEAPLLAPAAGSDPLWTQQQAGGLSSGIPVCPLPQAIFDFLQGSRGLRSEKWIAIDQLGRELGLTVQQEHLAWLRCLAGRQGQQGRIELAKLLQVGLGLPVGLNALDRIHQGGDIRDHGEGHH